MIDTIEKLRFQNNELAFKPKANETIPLELYSQMEAFFAELFQTSDFQFALPDDFAQFLKYFGDGYVRLARYRGGFIWDWHNIISETKSFADIGFNQRSNKEAWLVLGEYSDKHWYFLCCDPSSPHFGKVSDGEDSSPWNNIELLDHDFESFTVFLNSLFD